MGHSHQINLRMLLNGRLDLIMLADAYIRSVMPPETRKQLLFSEQHYGLHQLGAVTNSSKAMSAEQLDALLLELKNSGELAQILARHGL